LRNAPLPAKDLYHDLVVKALLADGWTITDDPRYLVYGSHSMYVDLGVERETLAAERQGERIAVEIKSFLSHSPVDDLQEALGAYLLYRAVSRKDRDGLPALPRCSETRMGRHLFRKAGTIIDCTRKAAADHL